ncbi:MAG: dihydropteroate synthase [Chloroflexota bacterium]|nr:dihydropteroate synthase [Chloroflexota bacterium]
MIMNSMMRFGKRTYVMGIINMSPESFSGDGFIDHDSAISMAKTYIDQGADIIDVGGQSTRPRYSAEVESMVSGVDKPGNSYEIVSEEIEIERVAAVVEEVSKLGVPVSIDTFKPNVAKAAILAGATIINDVTGLKFDIQMAHIASEYSSYIVLMHNQATAKYENLIENVADSLNESVSKAISAGVRRDKIIVDPGFGFGKTVTHNLDLLNNLDVLKSKLGYPMLLGTSRKSTIGKVLDLPGDQRVEGTAATMAIAISKGVDIIRVHDVEYMVRVAKMSDAIVRDSSENEII